MPEESIKGITEVIAMDRVKIAADLQSSGYNCAQAILGAFLDKTNLDLETAAKLTEGLGGGVGGQREVCGVVTAMAMIASFVNSSGDPKNKYTKKSTYELVSKLMDDFKAEHGSIICRELVGMSGDVKVKPCTEYVRLGAAMIERELFSDK